jgi:hypothetical protein
MKKGSKGHTNRNYPFWRPCEGWREEAREGTREGGREERRLRPPRCGHRWLGGLGRRNEKGGEEVREGKGRKDDVYMCRKSKEKTKHQKKRAVKNFPFIV